MTYPKIERRHDRAHICSLMIKLLAAASKAVYGPNLMGSTIDGLLVALAVSQSHAEGKPMTASKLAHYLSIPRTTVLRRLDDLVARGTVTKEGSYYFFDPDAVERHHHDI